MSLTNCLVVEMIKDHWVNGYRGAFIRTYSLRSCVCGLLESCVSPWQAQVPFVDTSPLSEFDGVSTREVA